MPIVSVPSPAISFAIKLSTTTGRNQVQRNTGNYSALYLVPSTSIADSYMELASGSAYTYNITNTVNLVISTSGPLTFTGTLANGSTFTCTINKLFAFDDTLTSFSISNAGTLTVRVSMNTVNSSTVAALPFVYYGNSVAPASFTADFVQALPNAVATDKNQTVTVTANTGETIYYCYPVINGMSDFTVNGLTGGLSIVAIVTLPTPIGPLQYYVYGSDNMNLGTVTLTVGEQ